MYFGRLAKALEFLRDNRRTPHYREKVRACQIPFQIAKHSWADFDFPPIENDETPGSLFPLLRKHGDIMKVSGQPETLHGPKQGARNGTETRTKALERTNGPSGQFAR
jgi:hypothetical protein